MYYLKERAKNVNMTRKRLILFAIFGLGVSLFIGYLVGRITLKNSFQQDEKLNYLRSLVQDETGDALKSIINELDIENIKRHLKYFTSIPHQAGTIGDKITADYMQLQWKNQGLDSVQMNDYDVLLDFTDDQKFNNIQIRESSGSTHKSIDIKETVYDTDLDYSKISKPFLALGTNGSITTDEIYYANECQLSDFEFLLNSSINVKDKIVICKYGGIFRGNKVKNAQNYGAKALILYDDPIRAAPKEVSDQIYPHGEFLPPDGVQRGSIYLKEGDPLTPIYPSTNTAYRINVSDSKYLVKIPGQVVGYKLVEDIFNLIESDTIRAPFSWIGELNCNYTLGGKLKHKRTLTLNVFNQRRTAKIFDVIGIIEGIIEPDRYVIIGNHRDAWTFGSADPNSGTSVMLEVSRILMKMKKEKTWKPKRSILFLSWSGEEYGSQGSTEWVEEHLKRLSANAVAYLNLDNIMKGNYSIQVKASPMTFDLLYKVTKSIQYDDSMTVFDRWLENEPNIDKTLPLISPYMGSGSDHMSFLQRAGVPCIDQRFIRNNKDPIFKNIIGSFPLYHSSYETLNLIDKFIDPNFVTRRLMTLIAAETIRSISSSVILPFNCLTYAKQIKVEFNKFVAKYQTKLDNLKISIEQLGIAIDNLIKDANAFHQRLNAIDKTRFNVVRQYNDQIRNLERAFLDPSTLEENGYMHMLFAPSTFNKYGAYSFPTLVESIHLYDKNKTSFALIEKIKYKLSITIYTIKSASLIMRDPIDFSRE